MPIRMGKIHCGKIRRKKHTPLPAFTVSMKRQDTLGLKGKQRAAMALGLYFKLLLFSC